MECELEFIGPISSEQLDVWRCKAHRYNFFHKRNEEPTACPVARGEVPGHPCAPLVNDGDALDLCPDCFEAFTESGKHRDRCEYCDGSGGVDSGGSSLRGYYSIDVACPECGGLGFIDT